MTKMLLDDLMDYAQLKNDSFNIVPEYFDLQKIIEQSLTTNSKSAESRQINLEGPIYTNSEDAIFFYQFYGDSRRYLQVLVNLVSNAIKFTRPGGAVSVIAEISKLANIKNPIAKESSKTIRESLHELESESIASSIPDKEILEIDYDKK